jgi:CRISPR-associated endonuclease Cas3-HD
MAEDHYLARPDQTLSSHLDGVVSNVSQLVPEGVETPQGEPLRGIVETVAHLHDSGKYTPKFQRYIREQPGRPPNQSEYHAAPGALLTFHALAEQGFSPATCVAGFYAVLWHHGALKNVEETHSELGKSTNRFLEIGNKLQRIEDNSRSEAEKRLLEATGDELGWEELFIDDPSKYQHLLRKYTLDDQFYQLLQRVWATLTCADKLDAAFSGTDKGDSPLEARTSRPDPGAISFDTDATDIENLLNELRSDAQASVAEKLAAFADSGDDIYRITLPTGFGKTFTGLNAALRHAESKDGRVIYALPYTTILDQVDEEIRSQFGVTPTSRAYTLHHYLSETRTEIDDERVSDGSELLYAKTWQAGLVLTTFVQLFETLAGPTNSQSVKIPALQDAVIVIDEPQVLSQQWWRLATYLIDILEKSYDATVIMMTATQPRFIEESSVPLDPIQLVPDPDRYFKFLAENERVQFEIDESVPVGETPGENPVDPTEAARRLIECARTNGGSTLGVTNTVANAGELSRAIDEQVVEDAMETFNLGEEVERFVEENGDVLVAMLSRGEEIENLASELVTRVSEQGRESDLLVATLSAALRPCDRQLLIALVSTLLEDSSDVLAETPLLVTSTQLIEAGVDLSFNQVYRDYAPLPSVVQAAGRCNRSFESERGRVVLWRLASDSRDQLPSSIYTRRRDRLTPTSTALDRVPTHGSTVSEYTLLTDGVKEYYDALHGADHRDYRRDELVEAYLRADGETLREASLIEDYGGDVLVIRSDAEFDVLRQYLDAKTSGAYHEGRALMTTLQQLCGSVPEDRAKELDESDAIVDQLGFDVELDEFAVLDARETALYETATGIGLRRITD